MNSDFPPSVETEHVLDGQRGSEPVPQAALPIASTPRRVWTWQRVGGKFLLLSILGHLLFIAVAAYLVVQTIHAKRQLTFQSGPKGPTAPTRALEHKVQMKKQNALSAPPQAKRVTTTGLAKVALPDMPAMPSMSAALSPGAISGMGAAGLAPGGLGGSMGGMGGGKGFTSFGFHDPRDGLLEGTFYDLKQTSSKQPTDIATPKTGPVAYVEVLRRFVQGGWNLATLARYYQAKAHLYAGQLYVPVDRSEEAPKAFGVQGEVAGDRWLVYYKGRIRAPRDGTFRFIGRGDNFLVVRLNKKNSFDGSSTVLDATARTPERLGSVNVPGWTLGAGPWFNVAAGDTMDIEVIIGDNGGLFSSFLMIEEKGSAYAKRQDDPTGFAYPVFQVVKMQVPKPGLTVNNAVNPQVAKDTLVFEGIKGVKSLLSR